MVKKLNKVKLVKEMARERIRVPRPQVIPDKRRTAIEREARDAAREGKSAAMLQAARRLNIIVEQWGVE